MRKACLPASLALLAALAGCARSDDASIPVNRADADVLPADMPVPVPSVEEPSAADTQVAAALRQHLAKEDGLTDNARWLMTRADLNGDGTNEALAYVVDPMHCGTGGCLLFILADRGAGKWEVTDVIGPSQLPVYQLPKDADGWTMLGISVGGGGAKPAVMGVAHSADGYVANPTAAPAKETKTEGAAVLIADTPDAAVAVPKA